MPDGKILGMDTFFVVIAVILGIVGIVGSVVPGIPGPPLSWLGMLLMYFFGGVNSAGAAMTPKVLFIWLAVTTVVTVLDYVIPVWFTKLSGGSKYAGYGAIIGLFVGLIFPPVGIILGTILGAFIAEFAFAQKGAEVSVKSAFGAFMGFLLTTGLKLLAAGWMLYEIIVYI